MQGVFAEVRHLNMSPCQLLNRFSPVGAPCLPPRDRSLQALDLSQAVLEGRRVLDPRSIADLPAGNAIC